GGHAAGLLGGACKSPLPQDIDGLLLDAFGLGERSFALHHSRAGLLSQGLNRCRCYLVCHYCLFLPLGLAVTTSKKRQKEKYKKQKRPEAQTSGPAHLFAFCLFAFALLSDFGLLGLQCFSGFSVWRVGGRSFERRGVQLSSFGRRRLGSFSRNLARGGGHFSLVASHCGLGNLWRTRRHIGRASLATAIAA